MTETLQTNGKHRRERPILNDAPTMQELIARYKEKTEAAKTADKKETENRVEAAQALAELRRRVQAGEAGDIYTRNWWLWFKHNINAAKKSRKGAEALLRIASHPDPYKAWEDEKAQTRERMRAYRAMQPESDGGKGASPAHEPVRADAQGAGNIACSTSPIEIATTSPRRRHPCIGTCEVMGRLKKHLGPNAWAEALDAIGEAE